jgi:hypothetical protein
VEKAPGYYDLRIVLKKGGLSAGLSEKVHIYAGLESAAVFDFDDDDFVKKVYLAGTLALPDSVTVSEGTISAYRDAGYTDPIGSTSDPATDGSWLITIPVANIPDGPVYFEAEMTGTDGKFYTGTGSTSDAVTEEGAQGIALAVNALTSISITKQPDKTTYNHNDLLDLSGLVVTADFGAGGTKTVSGGDYTASPANSDALTTVGSNRIVTINYKGKEATFTVTVERVLQRIAVTKQPTKTVYEKDENLDLTGLEVTAYYNDSSTETVNDWTSPVNGDWTISPAHNASLTTAGTQTVTITYKGETDTFTVAVNDPSVTGVSVSLPGLADGMVEQPKSGGTTFYGTGAVFTATVQGSTPPQAVTWTLTPSSGTLDVGTTITNGILTVAHADHGKELTVTATSMANNNVSGTAEVTAVSVMPSALYGKWIRSDNAQTEEITNINYKLTNNGSGNTHSKSLTVWEAAVNKDTDTQGEYPVGYKLTGTDGPYDASRSGLIT